MKTLMITAAVMACTSTFTTAQQYRVPAATPYWYQISNPTNHVHTYDYRLHGVPSVQVIQPQVQYVNPQTGYTQQQNAYVMPDATYVRPQYVQPQAAYGQQQPLYVQNPHHTPSNLSGYWPFISKAHSDHDFNRGVIHVYGGQGQKSRP